MAAVAGVHDRFWGLTLAEFRRVMDAHAQRVKLAQRLLAWHAANVMNMWTKRGKRIRVEQLLGDERRTFGSDADLVAAMRAQQERLDNA